MRYCPPTSRSASCCLTCCGCWTNRFSRHRSAGSSPPRPVRWYRQEGTLSGRPDHRRRRTTPRGRGRTPPPPTVYDVTEEAVEDLKRRGARFPAEASADPRRRRSGVLCSLPVRWALLIAAPGALTGAVLLVLAAICAFIGIVLGRGGNKVVAIPLVTITTLRAVGDSGVLGCGTRPGRPDLWSPRQRCASASGRCSSQLRVLPVVAWSRVRPRVLFVAVWMVGAGSGLGCRSGRRVGRFCLPFCCWVCCLGWLWRCRVCQVWMTSEPAGQEIMRGDVRDRA